MAKRQSQQSPANADVVTTEAAAPVAPKRVSLGVAKAANFGLAPNPSALARAALLKPAKGENPKRVRVYGYDNGSDKGRGMVPKSATIQLVPGTTGTPKGVTAQQWEKLAAQAGKTVTECYDAAVTSRTVRRSYRAGFIRFVNAAE